MGLEREIRLSGAGGQGLQLAARILAEAVVEHGLRVAQSQSYEPTSRGGISRSDLVVSDGPIDFPLVTALDLLVILDEVAATSSAALLRPGALVLADESRVRTAPQGEFTLCVLPFSDAARALGSERIANIVALGALADASGLCSAEALEQAIRRETPAKFVDLNLEALAAGRGLVAAVASS